ncbi:cob(I)yrinic acid a,c-diamide adenosyltransferase [Oceanisphaera avium]|uniref:Corrinoid adenosyltransferase n=1 Tax=Oceanisphaera avium TaxID=1903694 RepID=A0A1Y0CUT1_9GAMM|nr:cob(I)yrinic acid a,c-diamide adenosyltransferase [Oceanisphaera avium]ART79103.1 cob(I)yrinic acid a,c-diamide adenosyltransferase [Oceanisphaera avium]
MTHHQDNSKEDVKNERHQQRQQKLKDAVETKVASAQEERGVLMIITGNGKGKSTAGFGTLTRALGHGKRAAAVQFIKGGWECGERNVLQKLGVDFAIMNTGFTWDTQDRVQDTLACEQTWCVAEKMLADAELDIVLLDELTYMVAYHYLAVERVVSALKNRPAHQHVIITGRGCHRALLELADTVSEVQSIKHAFEAGVKAQAGFDY